ncbi:MAG: hypothetical protein ACYDCK_13270, partial [Thermoplasmatota archaeon]
PSRAALDAALAKAPAALAGAVEGIRAEGAREVATFRPATPIAERREPTRRVRCLLYADGENDLGVPAGRRGV